MGLIVDDNGLGIHGELRRESFSVYSDFAKEWDVELDLDKLDEMIFVLEEIRRVRNRASAYPEHHRFRERFDPKKETEDARRRRIRLEGAALMVRRLEHWGQTLSPKLRKELKAALEDLNGALDFTARVEKEWTPSRLERNFRKIQVEAMLWARNLLCPGCRESAPHRCRLLALRIQIARLDKDRETIGPKDWAPAPKVEP